MVPKSSPPHKCWTLCAQVIGEYTYNDPNIDGVFVDSGFAIAVGAANLTLQSRREMQLAQLSAFRTICTNMAAKGKVRSIIPKEEKKKHAERFAAVGRGGVSEVTLLKQH